MRHRGGVVAVRRSLLALGLVGLAALGPFAAPARAQAARGAAAELALAESLVADLLGADAGRAFLAVYRVLARDYLGDVDRDVLLDGALRGLVAALDDPYVRYLSPEEVLADAARRRDPDVVVSAAVGDVGYLRVTSFESERAGERFVTELDALVARGIRALVLDLRGNGGGLVLTGLQVLDRFLSDAVLGFRVGPEGPVPLGFANPRASDVPLAVLVDAGTASTAEIVAGALQRHGRARLYGARTAGKGVGQTSLALPNGGELRFVSFAWSLPDGSSVAGIGLVPEVSAPAGLHPFDGGELAVVVAKPALDPALAAAIAGVRAIVGDELSTGTEDDGVVPADLGPGDGAPQGPRLPDATPGAPGDPVPDGDLP